MEDYQNSLLDGRLYSKFLESDIAKKIEDEYNQKANKAASRAITAYYGGNIGGTDSYSIAKAKQARMEVEQEKQKVLNETYGEYAKEYPNYINNLYNEKLVGLKVQYGITD